MRGHSPAGVPDRLSELLTEARTLGFLGPGPVDRHVRHAFGFAEAFVRAKAITAAGPDVGDPARVLDLGSGGGLPGLVLAVCWPSTHFSLLDGNRRRTTFLERAVAALEVQGRVQVVLGRAEELGRQEGERAAYDLAVARSFGTPAVTAECAAPFLQVGGLLVTSEPPSAEVVGDRWPEAGLIQLGLARRHHLEDDFHYRAFEQVEPCPERYPRRVGVPSKRPLF